MSFKDLADKLYSKIDTEKKEDGTLFYYRKREVFPMVDRDGNINWFNFITGGSWKKLLMAIVITLISLGFIYEYHLNFQSCSEVMSKYNEEKRSEIFSNRTLQPGQQSLRILQDLPVDWGGELKNESTG